MVSTLSARLPSQVSPHLTIGCSTGYMADLRGDWPGLVREAAQASTFAVELAALSGPELPGLISYLADVPALPFLFVSVHAPIKQREISEAELVEALVELPTFVDAIVVHPETIMDPALYEPLGRCLVIENMDRRKASGQTATELGAVFDKLPEAGLCFDVAHVKSVDSTMEEGERILYAFGDRLRHVHLSSLDAQCRHVPLTADDEALFAPLLSQCRDVPWLLEAPLTLS
jgi:hypothetical protein